LRHKAALSGVGTLAFAGLIFLLPVSRRRWMGLAMLLALVSLTTIACGGGSSGTTTPQGGTTAGAYQVTVTGVDQATGQITETTTVNVTVN
jgi:hypothetical protein